MATAVHKQAFNLLLIVTMLVNMGVGVIIPLMPILMKDYGISATTMSVPFMVLILGRFIANNLGGSIIRRISGAPLLILGLSLFSLTMFLYPLADNLAVFTLLRFLEGIFEGFAVVSLNTMVLALSDRESRGHKMGLFGSAIGLGFILGPAFGSVVYMYLGMDYVFWLTAALALVAVVFLYCIRSSFETESPESTVNTQVETVSKFKSYITLLPYYLPMVLRRVVFFSFHMLLPLTLYEKFSLTPSQVALFFTGSAILTTILMPHTGKVVDRFDSLKILVVALVIMAACLGTMGISPGIEVFIALYVIETLAFAFALPAAMRFFSNLIAERQDRSVILGRFGSLVDISTMLVPIVLLPLYEYWVPTAWLFLSLLAILSVAPYGYLLLRYRSEKACPAPVTAN